MYSMAIERAERTFAANQRLRAETAALRAETSALVFTYRRHRFSKLAGGSDASDDDRVRRVVRDFVVNGERPKSFVGYSQGSVCQACGAIIKPNDIEYDLTAGPSELRVDAACYNIFMEQWRAIAPYDAPDAAGE